MGKRSNATVRNLMVHIYGRECMLCHRKLNSKRKNKKNLITFHHIVPVSEGGETTVENGAILCARCHENLHRQIPEIQRKLNKRIIKHKKTFFHK